MNKEECYKALNQMKDSCECSEYYCIKKCDACDVIEQLINEHFELKEDYSTLKDFLVTSIKLQDGICTTYEHSNPPLKFEELRPNMWVWDNFIKRYVELYDVDIQRKEVYRDDSNILCVIRFEENRFYRYEVKENEEDM